MNSNKNSIKSTLTNHLKHKNYPINDRFRKSDLVLTQSKEDFLMDLKIKAEISRTNSFTFSNISSLNGSQSLVDQQVSRLIKFIQCQRSSVVRRELEALMPPIICHLFIEMLKGKEWKPAHEFLRKYACLVGSVQDITQQRVNGSDPAQIAPQPIHFQPIINSQQHPQQNSQHFNLRTSKQPPQLLQLAIDEHKLIMFRELIGNLSCIRRLEDVKDKLICSFRSCKYKTRLANKTLALLNKYLSKHGHVLLIQILHLWFTMDLYELNDDLNADGSSSSSSSSYEECPTNINSFNHPTYRKADRFTDPSYCDTQEKDMKYSGGSANRTNAAAAPTFTSNDDSNDFLSNNAACEDNNGGAECGSSSNMKIKRLRECLHRIDQKYHKPIRIFNINFTENSLCTASTDKQLCHLAAGFEDSTIVLWSINGFDNYGNRPFQRYDDRHCQWSINNCNRMLTDDLSDYSTSDDEIERNLKGIELGKESDRQMITGAIGKRTFFNSNKFKRTLSIKEQWTEYTSRSCSENNFSVDSQSIILRGHRSSITEVLFGKKNDILLSTSRDKTFRLWKADSFTCASIYRGHEFPIWCIDESSNGCYAATGSRDTTARLWSYERTFPLRIYAGHSQDVDCIAFHPNGNYFATGSADTTIRMWCVTSGRLLRIFTESHLPVNAISFSPDGKLLAAAGDESKIRIFDLAAGQQLMDLKNHTASIKSLCWSENSKKLLSGCTDGTFNVWNINNQGLSSSSTSTKDSSKSSSSQPTASSSSSKHHSSSSTHADQSRSNLNPSISSSSLLQSNSTGCKRLIKVFFTNPDELVHAIGSD